MKHTQKISTISLLGALLFNTNVMAASCFDDGSSCSLKGKWYAGLEFGDAETQINDNAVSRFFDTTGIARNDVQIGLDDQSKALMFGYHFTDNLAVEAAYRDLGGRSVRYSGPNADRALFESSASAIFPETGEGFTIGAIASWPLTPRWRLSGKLGLMKWESDTQRTDGVVLGRAATDGSNLYLGVETSYLLSPRIQTYLGITRYHLDRDEVDVVGLGVRVFFGGEDNTTSAAAPKPTAPTKPVAQTRPVQPVSNAVTTEGDADGDGVLDSRDNCANTPSNHSVDSRGCTRYEPVNYEHELTIYYPNNSSKIDSSYMNKIEELVTFAKEHDIKLFKIVGHTSAPGESDYNQWLSERRAQSLATILKEKYGYGSDQIEALGKGENELAVSGNTEAAHSKNRRLVVHLSASGRIPMLKK